MTRRVFYSGADAVGYSEDRVYYTRRHDDTWPDGHSHYFRKFGGYGVSTHILNSLRFEGVVYVHIAVQSVDGSIKNMLSYVDFWFRKSSPYTYENDSQKILSTEYMWDEGKYFLTAPEEIEKERNEKQPTMFSVYHIKGSEGTRNRRVRSS